MLVGSTKPRGVSASEQLARAIAVELEEQGVEAELHYATEFVNDDAAALASARVIASADLFVLCSPLNGDMLPALVVQALELVAEVRTAPGDALFVPVLQGGLELEHTLRALRIARHFADHAGYHFAGALPFGAGSLTPERSLAEARPSVDHIARAIQLAAPALAAGESIPEQALQAVLKAPGVLRSRDRMRSAPGLQT